MGRHAAAGTAHAAACLNGGGEMGARMRACDWADTCLGAVESWSHSLRTAVGIAINSRYPMFVWWGPHLINLYNDAYIPMLGARHPAALGTPAASIWADIWNVVGPQADVVLQEGRATWNEEVLLLTERNHFTEETYFTWSYSPIADDDGTINGVFCAVTEETSKVLSRRRLKTLRDLSERALAEAKSVEQACRTAAETLAENNKDLPFVLVYLLDGDGTSATLREAVGIETAACARLKHLTIGGPSDIWCFDSILTSRHPQAIDNLESIIGRVPAGAWADEPTTRAVVAPLATSRAQESPAGFLVAGLSPRLSFDDEYRGFIELVAGHLATTIASARAYEDEKTRAEALAELDRAKTAFFSNISHEFRTPLTLMLGPLEELLRGPLPDPTRAELDVVHRNGVRLLKLVNTLLDFSRIEAGRIEAVFEPTDLASVTEELAGVFRSAIEHAGLRFVVDCPPLPETVPVDRGMWEKIVLNLLSNAFKFTLQGEVAIALRPFENDIQLSVRDTGVGIPAEELPHIFERFHQVKGSLARTHEGTGIGLALVKELVTLHGGTIHAESVEGRETRVTVSIPQRRRDVAPRATMLGTGSPLTNARAYVDEASGWLPEETGGFDPRRGVDERNADGDLPYILCVDDNADMRAYLSRLLRARYDVEAVADGDAALRAVRRRIPDLVVSDVMMPGLDGMALLRRLREDPKTRMVPVVLLSAHAGEEAQIGGFESGADDYLVKPFSSRAMLARVGAHLEIARVRKAILRKERAALVSIEASEAQRRRISRELHDELGQKLTALVLRLKAVQDRVRDRPAVQADLQRLQAMAGEVSNDMHRVALELRPGALDDRGLQTALTNYIEDWSTRHRIGTDFQHVGLGRERLPPHLETTVYRIVQEALTNVGKHAQATTVNVVLQRHGNDVVAIVEDNGCGFDVRSHGTGRDGRLGLVGMKERAALLGGACHVESQPGSTCVFARIPIVRDESSHA
jgi:signal transduction histidine kinase